MNMKLSIAAAVAAVALVSSMASASLIVSFNQTDLALPEVNFAPSVPAGPNSLQVHSGFSAPVGVRVVAFDGSIFNNVVVELTGLTAVGSAGSLFGSVGQELGAGTFTLKSGLTVLLAGTVNSPATLFGSSTSGSVTSNNVTYTGGTIFTAFQGVGGVATGGELSFSLLNITPALSVTAGNLNTFAASVTGQFSGIIPEPSALGLLAPAALVLVRRRK